jgi:L-amino acid N-acyltransferase YncA
MELELEVRNATPGDIPAITAIYAHHVLHGTGTFEEEPPSKDEMSIRLAKILANRYCWLVAVDPSNLLSLSDGPVLGGIVGYGYYGPFRERSAYRFTVEDSVYVHPACQGRGIGGKLLDALIERAEQDGKRKMVAVIGDSANTGSVALHARAGFTESGTLAAMGWKFDRWLDIVFMDRDLGPGASSPATFVDAAVDDAQEAAVEVPPSR